MEINSSISSLNKILGTYQATKAKQPDTEATVSAQESSKNSDLNNIEDKAEISQDSKDLLQQDKINQTTDKTEPGNKEEYTSEQKYKIDELKNTDKEVKAHEQAHMAAAGGIATSSPSYKYEEGPDGKQYAVSGEVNIRVTSEQDPEKTIEKAEQAKKAALAPSDPSSQDRNVAGKADQMIQKAKSELNKNKDSSVSSLGLLADVVA